MGTGEVTSGPRETNNSTCVIYAVMQGNSPLSRRKLQPRT